MRFVGIAEFVVFAALVFELWRTRRTSTTVWAGFLVTAFIALGKVLLVAEGLDHGISIERRKLDRVSGTFLVFTAVATLYLVAGLVHDVLRRRLGAVRESLLSSLGCLLICVGLLYTAWVMLVGFLVLLLGVIVPAGGPIDTPDGDGAP